MDLAICICHSSPCPSGRRRRLTSPSDASFVRRLENMTPHSLLPPLSIVVMRPTRNGRDYTFLRLHLVVVDLYRHWSSKHKGLGIVWHQSRNAAPYCSRMASHDSLTREPHSNDRYVFGYARDNSTFPVFLLNPARWQQETFTLVALYTGVILPLDATPEICILSLEHFYDSFRAAPMTSLRSVVLAKYGLMPDMLTHGLRVSQQTAAAVCRPDVRDLVGMPTKRVKKTRPLVRLSTPRAMCETLKVTLL